MQKEQDGKNTTDQQEAERILKQVERDSQSIVLGGLPVRTTSNEADEAKGDTIELWGRRIGRSLAVIAAALILAWLFITLGER